MLIERGKITHADPEDGKKPYPRTAVGIDPTGTKVWFVLLTKIFQDLGVDSALNLDGGGSTTLVAEIASKNELPQLATLKLGFPNPA